jgi:hypothetical protein
MTRIGINAKPTGREPRTAIRPGDVPAALDRLGITDVAAQYQHLMLSVNVNENANAIGDQS